MAQGRIVNEIRKYFKINESKKLNILKLLGCSLSTSSKKAAEIGQLKQSEEGNL